jgi:hypothetical protein
MRGESGVGSSELRNSEPSSHCSFEIINWQAIKKRVSKGSLVFHVTHVTGWKVGGIRGPP